MPVSSTSLDANVSGTTGAVDTPINYVTLDAPYLFNSLQDSISPPTPSPGAIFPVPSLLFLAGDVHYRVDNQGNVVAENPNKDGSLPV